MFLKIIIRELFLKITFIKIAINAKIHFFIFTNKLKLSVTIAEQFKLLGIPPPLSYMIELVYQ
jgi:hypothetical protein